MAKKPDRPLRTQDTSGVMVPGIYPDVVFLDFKTAGNVFQLLVYFIREGMPATGELNGQFFSGTLMCDNNRFNAFQV